MKKKHFHIISLILIGAFMLTAGFGCKAPSQEVQKHLQPITLEYWRVWDDEDAFEDIITAYQQIHPNIKINYRKFRYDEYEQELLDALAEDRGPDIFSIHESWLKKYQQKLEPMPEEITMAYQEVQGALKKEVVSVLKTKKSLSLRQVKEYFADTVYKDVVLDGKVYGLPLSLETLVMFYNRDILNRSGVAEPPSNWQELSEAVQKINRFSSKDEITQSGVAMGTADNINRSFDILSILMMQNGAEMTDINGYATFFKGKDKNFNPGVEATYFYLDFGQPVKSVYSWNSEMPNAFDSFLNGQVAIMFDYNHQIPSIRSRAPRLNFAIAPIPQINSDDPKNFAGYWVETISKKSEHTAEAWDFIIFATDAENVDSYLEATNQPTALKSLINSQLDNEDLYPTAIQTLTAENWYSGSDPLAAENALREMVESLLEATSEKEANNIMETTIQKINQTIK